MTPFGVDLKSKNHTPGILNVKPAVNNFTMDFTLFKRSLSEDEPPKNSSVYLMALWYDAKGDWDKAHDFIQDINDKTASWIHAYLHRKEGDVANAGYWYNRASKKIPAHSLEKEWEEIVNALIN